MSDYAWAKYWVMEGPLGGGGQGDTFVVRNAKGDPAKAVLKLLKESRANDPKSRRRMYQEVANLRTLGNAGASVPKIYDGNTEQFEMVDVPLFFVMEFVDGKTLDEVVKPAGGISLEASIGICNSLCKTLKIAVKEGIVHRDIKPENLKVRNLNKADVVMLDFGLSFNKDVSTNVTETDEALDNKFISLPERRGPYENKRDPRSDITSICAVLYYCLTGISPRNLQDSQGRPPHRWNESLLSAKIKNPAQLSFLNSCLDKGLSNEIADRFQTVEELEKRLDEILRPYLFPPDEDLETIAKAQAKALYVGDIKTRTAVCRRRLDGLLHAFHTFIASKTNKLFPFLVKSENAPYGDKDLKLLYTMGFSVNVERHPIRHIIEYKIYLESNECCIYRQLIERRPNNLVEPQTPILVNRYLAETTPDVALIVKDLEGAIKESILTLSDKIQKGYENPK